MFVDNGIQKPKLNSKLFRHFLLKKCLSIMRNSLTGLSVLTVNSMLHGIIQCDNELYLMYYQTYVAPSVFKSRNSGGNRYLTNRDGFSPLAVDFCTSNNVMFESISRTLNRVKSIPYTFAS